MATSTFAALKERFSATTSNNNQNNYYPFHKMPDDSTARVRFLPDADTDNPMGFLVEKVTHNLKINGENKTVPCLFAYGEDCPICKVAKEFYDVQDKTNGKIYYKKRTYLAQAIIVEDPIVDNNIVNADGQVKLISVGYTLFKIIKDAFESGELDEAPYNFEGGTDFLIKKNKQGEYASYTLSKFVRKSTDLDAEQIEVATAGSVVLSTLLPKKPELAFVQNILEAALTGKSLKGEEDDDSDDSGVFAKMAAKAKQAKPTVDEDDDEEFVKPVAKPAPVEKPVVTKASIAPTAKAVVEDSDDDAEAQDLLKQLKAKRDAAKRLAAGE